MCNHHMLATDDYEKKSILEEAAGLCARIKAESDDVWLAKDAVSLEATQRSFSLVTCTVTLSLMNFRTGFI